MSLFFSSLFGDWWLGPRSDECPWKRAERVRFFGAPDALAFLEDLLRDPLTRSVLRRWASQDSVTFTRRTDDELIQRLARALAGGAWVAYRRPDEVVPVVEKDPRAEDTPPPPPAPEDVPREKLKLQLVSDEGFPVPDTEYVVTSQVNGEERRGRLGLDGTAILPDVPAGAVAVKYPNGGDITAKAYAAAARDAFDGQDLGPVYRLLEQSPAAVQGCIAAYDRYFNDFTGEGFVEDIEAAFTDPDALLIARTLLARAEVGRYEAPVHVDWREQDGLS